MRKLYSNVDASVLLYVINRQEEINCQRQDLSPATEYLQVSCKVLKEGDKFRPHKHLHIERKTLTTHESWVILKGVIKATFYDIDDSVYSEEIMSSGDCAISFSAGHSFEVLEDDTMLYEFKNGPYYGVEKDKEFIR